jgi:hypothetical protein
MFAIRILITEINNLFSNIYNTIVHIQSKPALVTTFIEQYFVLCDLQSAI